MDHHVQLMHPDETIRVHEADQHLDTSYVETTNERLAQELAQREDRKYTIHSRTEEGTHMYQTR